MKTFNVNGKLGSFEINLPESLKEIPVDYFKECTDYIHPARDYAVVAIVYKDSLNLILTAAKKKNNTSVAIIPVFVKMGETDSEFAKTLNMGDRIVIAGSDLSLGHHINSPYNKITPDNIYRVCENADKEFYKDTLNMHTPVCFVEFKLVPLNAIHAKLDETKNSFVNPFVRKTLSINGEA